MKKTEKKLGRGFERVSENESDIVLAAKRPDPPGAEATPSMPRHIMHLPLERITPNPQQPREHFDQAALEGLVASIKSSGLLQPITVRRVGGEYQIVAGERRWRAAGMAGLETIPAIVRGVADEDMLQIALLENIQREDLDPVEKARAYKRLSDEFRLSQEEIAKKVGQKRSTIANYLRLLELSPAILQCVSRGTISMGHARALLAVEGIVARTRLCEKIISEGLSVRAVELEAAVRRGEVPVSAKKTRKSRKAVSPHVREIEESLTKSLGAKVRILLNEKTGRGKLIVEFYSPDDFEKLQTALTSIK